jgi:signal transduction histidine kinase
MTEASRGPSEGGGVRRAGYAGILLAAFALVVIAGCAAVYMSFRTADAEQLVSHSYMVRQATLRLLSDLQDVETGQRGYLLTRDSSYLQPFNAGNKAAPETMAALEKLTEADPGQAARIAALAPLVQQRLGLAQQSINSAQDASTQSFSVVESDDGKEVMDRIRTAITAIAEAERQQLVARQAAAANARGWLLALICSSLIAAVGLAAFLGRTARLALADARSRAKALETEITEHRATQETLRQAQKIEAVGQLTGGIAHDFNNLLTIILGNLDTVRRRIAERSDISEEISTAIARPLDLALQGARSAAQLTHRLLAFSRRQALEPKRLDLNRLISDLSDLLNRTLGEIIAVETIMAGGLWPTFADANQVENALLNLCVNARDAMPDGGRLTIETANTYLDEAYTRRFGDISPGQYVMLSVADTGSGIPSDLLERAFEPFFTTKPPGQGSGLGLAMVHGFVKQSGGHVRIYSEVGQGTTVKVYLPRLMEEETASAPAPQPVPERAAVASGANQVVLLVEDNTGVREFARSALEDLGYVVLEAGDGEAALRLLAGNQRVDLLFTDVVLPGMSGRELANRVLALRSGLPVLFTTGYTRNAIIHHGRLDPGVQLLPKPFAQHELARKVRELLDGSSQAKA